MQDFCGLLDRLRRIARALLLGWNLGNAVGLVPGGVGGQDQGRDLRRGALGGGNRRGAVGGDRFGIRRGADPGRHRPGQALDVGGQRRVEADVVDRMLADDVDDAGIGLLGVVQIGKAVGEAWAEMQQRRGRRALHAEIAVRCTGHDALEQAEHAAHAGHAVESCDKMHLGGAWVGEADIHPTLDHRPHQAFRTVHSFCSRNRQYPKTRSINHCSLVPSKQ
ncbi:hypothetical protein ABIF76_002377 [Bradyrhizobium ottawaense]